MKTAPRVAANSNTVTPVINARGVFLQKQLKRLNEEAVHRAVIEHLDRRAVGGTLYWHTPNGEVRHKGAAGKLKAMGTKAGMPDILLFRHGQLYGLELKREGGGRTSPMQVQRLDELTAAGALTGVAHGIDAALSILKGWGLIR